MKVAVIDFETTGIDTTTCRPIEVAVSIANSDFSEILEEYSQVMYDETYPALTEDIENLTGINQSHLLSLGRDPASVFAAIVSLIKKHDVDYIMAYNSDYDRQVYASEIKRHPLFEEVLSPVANMKWLCAMKDVKTNYNYKCWKLSHLALDYGVAIDPSKLHRAKADVDLTISFLKKIGVTLQDIVEFSQTPWVPLEAVTKKPWTDGGVSTGKAKEKGFRWETPQGHMDKKFSTKWVIMKKESDVRAFVDSCPELTIRRIV